MIISRTPVRVSLFGGGSDYPAYYREHGGEVLGFAIDKYVWLTLRRLPPFFAHRHRIVHSEIELTKGFDDIHHPVVRELFKMENFGCGLELHYDGDLPARSGVGSSSSFTVGLLNVLHAFKGHMATREALARLAITLERDILQENVGAQDQVWAAYGGFNRIFFRADDTFDVSPIIIPNERRKELMRHMMLFFTGISRFASDIAGEQIRNMPKNQDGISTIRQMVPEALSILQSPADRLNEIGWLLHDAWRLKRELSASVSNPEIDAIYDAARSAGAIGGKLLGAGGGGFMLLFAPRGAQKAIREALSSLIEVPFSVAYEGSRIVMYESEGL